MSSRQQKWLLSGGIGSGKSTVRRLLEQRGVQTVDADSIGHEVLASGGAAVREVGERWPDVLANGVIDRKRLAHHVFADPGQLAALEGITHPHIFAALRDRLEVVAGPVVVEIPLLVQPLEEPLPRIVVDAPDTIRVERAIARGGSPQDVANRMTSQPSRAQWLAAADLVIPNAGSLDDLEAAVARVVGMLQG